MQYPASCENVIGVGSVGKNTGGFRKSSFSTANKSVFVSAPGESIWTVSNLDETSYQCKDGTSYSSPIVAAAVVGAKQINPDITVSEFKEYLKETSVDIGAEGYDEETGYGVIDFGALYEAVMLNDTNTSEPTSTPVATTEPTVEPTITPIATPEVKKEIEASFSYLEEDDVIELCVVNNTGSELKLVELVAVFDEEDNLIQMKYVDTLCKGNNNLLIAPEIKQGIVKVFLWEDILSMKPYKNFEAKSYDFEI